MKGFLSYRAILVLFLLSVAGALLSGKFLLLGAVPLMIILVTGFTRPAIIFFLLLFTIPLSTEYQFSSSLGTDLPDETLMWLLSPVLLFMLLRNLKMAEHLFSSRIMVLIIVSLCWTLVTVVLSELPLISLKFFLAKIWYIIPFVIGTGFFLQGKKQQLVAANIMLAAMLFTVIVILVRHGIEGFSFETINDVTAPFFRNHVNYGALLVCMIPVAWAVYRAGNKFWIIGLVILSVGLAFSYSRGAWLALGVALVVVYFLKMGKLQWLMGFAALLVIGSAVWFLRDNRYLQYRPQYEKTIYHASFDEHMAATYKMQDMSTIERFYRWIAATKMAKENWLTGSGPNSFYPIYKSFTANDFRTYVSDNPEKSTVHNYFLLLLTEQGIPGLLLFLSVYVTMLLSAQKTYHQTSDSHIKGLMLTIGAILGMIGVLIFLSDLIETDKIGSVFYLCAGILLVSQRVKGPKYLTESVSQV
jgi:O-antigen ligase